MEVARLVHYGAGAVARCYFDLMNLLAKMPWIHDGVWAIVACPKQHSQHGNHEDTRFCSDNFPPEPIRVGDGRMLVGIWLLFPTT
jgi:hypothetical protein